MDIAKKDIKKLLNKKILLLNDIIADIDSLLTNLETDFYRVSIFGSARIESKSPNYQNVYQLAYELSSLGVDIVTGGGPGLMDAANKGAKDGGKRTKSIGLPIDLPLEISPNSHLDIKRNHRRFSSRLDEFMRISHAVVVTPGGIGTLLELLFTWQLIQVKHIKPRPILLLEADGMWEKFLRWVKDNPLKQGLLGSGDLNYLILCNSVSDIISHLEPEVEKFYKKNKAKSHP